MKIDLKRFQGRELGVDAAAKKGSVAESRESTAPHRDYGWMVLVALIAIGWVLKIFSWTALLIFLGLCAAVLVLMVASAIWAVNNTW